ncbi:unnamed protein product (macronuclear) [Paramecium tetraurelia]|uniref:Uncharacterized protein n=1 Tax=Paramecium tetraurelia TaxID=5888 RepID=A0BH96_PARTE|nr:uncharacterized protein GSPATT00028948001 [Paramecium tetraurelia]CAK57913.1 unnamed protein product [Paramecium tetraurelia]|eukprot:XP_001425311.1 hypothetical protein (macronuclear) [Paramecium tetraurelia strain d4-2]
MNAKPKDAFSASLSKFHRKSVHSQMANTSGCNQLNDGQNIPLPELKVRGLQSAKIKASPKRSPHILKFYVHEAQCMLNDPIKKANVRRYENQSEYVFVDTYLDALHVIAQEEKRYKQANGQTIQSDEFSEQQISINPQPTLPNLPAQLIRERMRVYAQSQQKEPQSSKFQQSIKISRISISLEVAPESNKNCNQSDGQKNIPKQTNCIFISSLSYSLYQAQSKCQKMGHVHETKE